MQQGIQSELGEYDFLPSYRAARRSIGIDQFSVILDGRNLVRNV